VVSVGPGDQERRAPMELEEDARARRMPVRRVPTPSSSCPSVSSRKWCRARRMPKGGRRAGEWENGLLKPAFQALR